jgi:Uma2 family endonuclease
MHRCVELEREFIAQPDVFVLPMAEWRRVAKDGPPIRQLLLAVEVLSPSSSRHDRVRERPLYQRNVPNYWLIDLDARLFEHWTPGDDRPALVTDTLVWQPDGAATPFALHVQAYFASILDA